PKEPPRVPDPREFDVQPDKNNRLQFSFHGQPWPRIAQWLASVSGYSLDWQELPADYINVSTERPYTIVETRDLLNRLLLDRGFTMVLRDEVLSIVKLDKVDPSLLPRVDDQETLLDLPAHDFVKITFTLPDELKADQAANDVKPLLSPHAKVQPLMATNRLLVIDIVANLREVSRLVNAEHAASVGKIVPREFVIEHARADQVADQIMILLGLDPSSRRTPQELQVEQQRLQLFAQMQQRGADVAKYLRKGETPEVFLTVNYRRNSILANAPPATMTVIERAVKMLDTNTTDEFAQGHPATTTGPRIEKYALATLTPQTLVTSLEELGNLDPRTRLKVDTENRAVLAYATETDHERIEQLIERLDGAGRELEVIWLRRLPAKAVAKTIMSLMVGEQEKDKSQNRRPYYYYDYYSFGRGNNNEQDDDGFRVDADVENNRLLLWANAVERTEVLKFLEKLGEIPGKSGNPNNVRVFAARDDEATQRTLEQLRLLWPAFGNNELIIEAPPEQPSTTPDPSPGSSRPSDDDEPLPDTSARRNSDRSPRFVQLGPRSETSGSRHVPIWYAQLERVSSLADEASDAASASAFASDGDAANSPTATPPAPRKPSRPQSPVMISVTPDGRLVITSADTVALDQMEELLRQIAPPAQDYRVFYLKYALASMVSLNLEEYFDEEATSSSDEDNYWRGWYGLGMSDSRKSDDSDGGLSDQRTIRFIYDYDTNSILVTGGTAAQLATVEKLIEVYDQPPSEESISARRFEIFTLKHARATDVAKTIKEVYRDLLSSKDKEFQQNRGDEKQNSQTTNYYRVFGSSNGDDKKPTKIKASFAGALSVGVNEVSNTIIISAQEEWIASISQMIEFLDRGTEPYVPAVELITTDVDGRSLAANLAKALAGAEARRQANNENGQPTGETAQNPGQTSPPATTISTPTVP
ncbi:MAG: hypothetical protein KDA60_18720, partial [Planctomycetales bacterium]|nr:hypothetical protein [Planctomycetales bacterium]